MVDELAEVFITEKKINNYYLLFLMNKTPQKLSDKFCMYLFDEEILDKRKAIIIALWVVQHQNGEAYRSIIDKFLSV